MWYGVAFFLIGLGFVAQAVMLGGWGLLLLWPAISFATVGIAYAVARPRMLGKRPDGRFSLAAMPVLLPFMLFAWVVWHVRHWVAHRGPSSCEVAPGVWLGRRAGAHELPAGVTTVIDLTAEMWPPRGVAGGDGRAYLCVPTLDATATDEASFRAALDRVAAAPGPVYIHCAYGFGRSAALAAAVLIRRGLASDVDEAEAVLARARPGVRLYPRQREVVGRATVDRERCRRNEPA